VDEWNRREEARGEGGGGGVGRRRSSGGGGTREKKGSKSIQRSCRLEGNTKKVNESKNVRHVPGSTGLPHLG